MDHILFIHSSLHGHLGCVHHLAMLNSAAMNVGVQISIQVPDFNSFEHIPRSGIAESYSNYMFNFFEGFFF